jgi:hypothetical protein
MGDVRRMSDYVYLVFRHGNKDVEAVCEDLGTADRWIWRNAGDTRDYYSMPKFVHPAGSLDGPMPDPQPATPPKVGVTLAEYHRRWTEVMAAWDAGRLTPREASAAINDLTSQVVWR